MRFINLIGKKFGRLSVMKRTENSKDNKPTWLCKCDCGNEKRKVRSSSLVRGLVKSCGCLRSEKNKLNPIKHNLSKSYVYRVWASMIQRCKDINSTHYACYGGRGIIVCDRWDKSKGGSFKNFYQDVGDPPTEKHTLDRINNNGNYTTNNWRWATRKEQSRNRRDNRLYTFNKKTQCSKDWAREYRIKYNTLLYRLNKGMSIQEALTTPVRKRKTNAC